MRKGHLRYFRDLKMMHGVHHHVLLYHTYQFHHLHLRNRFIDHPLSHSFGFYILLNDGLQQHLSPQNHLRCIQFSCHPALGYYFTKHSHGCSSRDQYTHSQEQLPLLQLYFLQESNYRTFDDNLLKTSSLLQVHQVHCSSNLHNLPHHNISHLDITTVDKLS